MAWLLNESNFTWKDRLKICSFFLKKEKFWTMTDEVAEFEEKMAYYTGAKYAVFVSSGSTANTLLAMYLKDQLKGSVKNTIVFPSTTWTTSVAPFIREGFLPHFIDIDFSNLSIDLNKLEKYLKNNTNNVACVFVTSLLGFSPNIDRLLKIQNKYGINIMLDNCESTLTKYNNQNISSYFTSTTSTYFGHLLQSVEGGFVFTNKKEEYEYFLMARNHGMVRSLKTDTEKNKYSNPDVDSRFDFNKLGNNFRNTNINAYIGQLDFNKKDLYIQKRQNLYDMFFNICISHKKITTIARNPEDVPFCLPLIFNTSKDKDKALEVCKQNNIETRPIISGNLLRQTCYKQYGQPEKYKVSDFLHKNGMYVGLHYKVKEQDIEFLLDII